MYKNSFPIILRWIENFVKWKLVVWNLYYVVWKQIRVTAAASLMVYLDEILLFIARVNFKFTTNSIIRCTIIQPSLSRHILKTKIYVLQRTWFTNSLHLLVTYNQPTTNLVQQTSILRLYSVSFSEEQLFKRVTKSSRGKLQLSTTLVRNEDSLMDNSGNYYQRKSFFS